jgi:Fic family protein
MSEEAFEDKQERLPWQAPEPMIIVPGLQPRIVQRLHEIGEFNGRFARLVELSPDSLQQLKRVATIESAGSSTRIEGAMLSDAEVEKVLDGISVNPFRSRDEAEVKGYGELLTKIFDAHDQIQLTENWIKQLHQILLAHSEKDSRHRGDYKSVGNDVAEVYDDGRPPRILFRTASPANTRFWMPRLLEETRAALADPENPKLVVIADFVMWFLAIHPFQDGNGRLSRAITTLLMLKHGYGYVPYASMEKVIEDNKANYYRSLRASQLKGPSDPSEYREWLDFFTGAVLAQQQNLQARLDVMRQASQLPEIQKKIFGLLEVHGVLSTPDIARRLQVPERTVRYHLRQMSEGRVVEQEGTARKTRRYRLPLRQVG